MTSTSRPTGPRTDAETAEVDPDTTTTPGGDIQGIDSAVLAGSLREYLGSWVSRVRGGESGLLPVVAGFIVIIIIFQTQQSLFLSAGNLVNLLVQGATYVLLGMAEIFVLLLGEIDLSAGFVAGVGAVVTVALAGPHNQPWWIAILGGLAATAVLGIVQGLLITRLRLPSFVVTLAGLLGFEGLLIYLVDREGGPSSGGTIPITNNVLANIVYGNMGLAAGWILMAVVVVAISCLWLLRDRRRRSSGLVTPPIGLTLIKIAILAVAGILLVIICNTNRGYATSLQGVPWVVPIVLAILALWSFVLDRTRFGRYVYAIGGNAEAARRSGISLNRIRLLCFMLCSLTAGAAGIIYASRLGSISNNVDGGQLVLYAVAAAVIGGTSLYGGRGKMVHALLGGLVIATIVNGMSLMNLSAAVQYMVTALVLLAAVTVDAVARRGRTAD
ncbi:MAG: sugar ABC transporter permease [Nocardioidaceae bacterium]